MCCICIWMNSSCTYTYMVYTCTLYDYTIESSSIIMNTTSITCNPDDADKYILFAKIDNARILHNLVKAVNFREVCKSEPIELSPFLNMISNLTHRIVRMLSFVHLRRAWRSRAKTLNACRASRLYTLTSSRFVYMNIHTCMRRNFIEQNQ